METRDLTIGVALGAGSARGWAHIGVLRALGEAGIHPDIVCGTSIGALVGAVYADDDLEALESWVTQLSWRKVAGFFDISLRGGLIKGEKLIAFMHHNFMDKDIASLARAFGAIATDLRTGREVWLREGLVSAAVRASMSVPGLFTPCERDGQLLLDGGLVNPVPVSLCRAMGADFVIAVDLSSDFLGQSARRGVSHRRGVEPPNLVEVITSSIDIMQVRITRSRLAGEPADAVIMPRLAHIGLLEYHRASEAIEEGRAAVAVAAPQMRLLLGLTGLPPRSAEEQ